MKAPANLGAGAPAGLAAEHGLADVAKWVAGIQLVRLASRRGRWSKLRAAVKLEYSTAGRHGLAELSRCVGQQQRRYHLFFKLFRRDVKITGKRCRLL